MTSNADSSESFCNFGNMCTRPERLLQALVAAFLWLCPAGSVSASSPFRPDTEGKLSVGTIHSIKGVGLCADIQHGEEAFSSMALTADLIDIVDGRSSTPGQKFTYHYNVLLSSPDDGALLFYAGPGVTAGHVRNIDNNFGYMAGMSVDGGARLECMSSIVLSLELQVDFGLIFKNRNIPDMSLYKAGFRHSYYPHLRIQYRF